MTVVRISTNIRSEPERTVHGTKIINGSMTTPAESTIDEGRGVTNSFLKPKALVRIGAWNVRTMYEPAKTAQVTSEMERYNIDILGISECRWTGAGRQMTKDGATILYSGRNDQHSSGVALIISKRQRNVLIEWEPISDRLIRARLDSKYCKLTVIQCYAPTNEAEEEEKDDWYEQLQLAISKTPRHDMLFVMGDMNAKVGADNTNREKAMGKQGCGSINENGERLVNFCLNNGLIIGGTVFPHKDVHKLTWTSPDGHTVNQIDHMIINQKWRRSLRDVRVYRGADANSDHYLVIGQVKLKLRQTRKVQNRQVFDTQKLRRPAEKQEFVVELRNRFSVLAEEPTMDIEEEWETIKNAYTETSKKVLGYRKKKNKEWITPVTWLRIEERRKIKEKLLSTKSPRLKEQVTKQYRDKDKQIKRSARKDKRAYLEDQATEAERAAARGQLSTVYKITKQLCKTSSKQIVPVKDKSGVVLTSEKEQAERWVEHFREVLNQVSPEVTAEPPPPQNTMDIDCSPPTINEIVSAIKKTKSGKAPGIDGLHAEMLKTDPALAAKVLKRLFDKIWDSEKVPNDWCKGLIVKLPKKGDLRHCDNW